MGLTKIYMEYLEIKYGKSLKEKVHKITKIYLNNKIIIKSDYKEYYE